MVEQLLSDPGHLRGYPQPTPERGEISAQFAEPPHRGRDVEHDLDIIGAFPSNSSTASTSTGEPEYEDAHSQSAFPVHQASPQGDSLTDPNREASPTHPNRGGQPHGSNLLAASLQAAAQRLVPEIISASAGPVVFHRYPDEDDSASGAAAAVVDIGIMAREESSSGDQSRPDEDLEQYYAALDALEAEARGGAKAATPSTILALLSKRVEQGERDAEAAMGMVYFFGLVGETKDVPRALAYYQKAANAGHVGAARVTGYIYQTGRGGVPQDLDQAKHYLHIAATSGDVLAQWRFGLLWLGSSIPWTERPETALKWLRAAHKAGLLIASLDLGRFSIHIGQKMDSSAAGEWFRRARECFEAAAEKDHPTALYYLGKMWQKGVGTVPSPSLAEPFFMAASRKGHMSACVNLILRHLQESQFLREKCLFAQGEIVWREAVQQIELFPQDEKKQRIISDAFVQYSIEKWNASTWPMSGRDLEHTVTPLLRALQLNPFNAAARNNLGVLFEHGYITGSPDLSIAQQFYRDAQTLGEEKGRENLARLTLSGSLRPRRFQHTPSASSESLLPPSPGVTWACFPTAGGPETSNEDSDSSRPGSSVYSFGSSTAVERTSMLEHGASLPRKRDPDSGPNSGLTARERLERLEKERLEKERAERERLWREREILWGVRLGETTQLKLRGVEGKEVVREKGTQSTLEFDKVSPSEKAKTQSYIPPHKRERRPSSDTHRPTEMMRREEEELSSCTPFLLSAPPIPAVAWSSGRATKTSALLTTSAPPTPATSRPSSARVSRELDISSGSGHSSTPSRISQPPADETPPSVAPSDATASPRVSYSRVRGSGGEDSMRGAMRGRGPKGGQRGGGRGRST